MSDVISYTSKDYTSIINDLITAIPSLTDKWKNYAEDDPGIVLLKLLAHTADMLCYNMDYQVLETFPQTATQRKNAANQYELIGYKMHWYQSATTTITVKVTQITDVDDKKIETVTIPQYTTIVTNDGTPYVIIDSNLNRQITVSGSAIETNMLAVQGSLQIMSGMTTDTIPASGRIYFNSYNPDESHMELALYNDLNGLPVRNETWIQTDSLLAINEEGRYYEFKVDDNDMPYIQLCTGFEQYLNQPNTSLRLTYIDSNGSAGSIGENIGFQFNVPIYADVLNTQDNVFMQEDISQYVSITGNTLSSLGKNPESVEDARQKAFKEAKTLDVAVTLDDYEVYAEQVDGIRKVRALDRQRMIQLGMIILDETGKPEPGPYSDTPEYYVRLEVITDNYGYITTSMLSRLSTLLDSRKVFCIECGAVLGKTQCIPYNIIIHATEPYRSSAELPILISNSVKNTLGTFYRSDEREFGEIISFADTSLLVQSASDLIKIADIQDPYRNVQIDQDSYPRLGPVCVTLSDDPSLDFLQNKVFDSESSSGNYTAMKNIVYGDLPATGSTVPSGTTSLILKKTLYVDKDTGVPQELAGSNTTELPLTWWCSRTDIVPISGATAGTIASSVPEDTIVELFCIVNNGTASMTIRDSVKLTIAQRGE